MERRKILKVINVPQNQGYVPGVKVSGKWLNKFDFNYGEAVLVVARNGLIVIKKMSQQREG